MQYTKTKRYTIWTCYFTRSEKGPLTPLLNNLRRDPRFQTISHDFSNKKIDADFLSQHLTAIDPDIVLCGFDRPEMTPVAYVAYHMNIPIAQIFAGDIAGGAWDDADRFAISQYASLLFVSGNAQKQRLLKALAWRKDVGDAPKIIVSGATHFDDMTASPVSCVSEKEGFNVVLYNPPSRLGADEIKKELDEILQAIGNDITIWFEPNGDRFSDLVMDYVQSRGLSNIFFRKNIERNRFLGYLMQCRRFIGNSSALFYEGQCFNAEKIQIGVRNRYREPVENTQPGASKIIADEIYKYLEMRPCKSRP